MSFGQEFPNFTANTTVGEIKFHDWLGDSWGLFFSHPADFTPVCTTELARVVKLYPEFVKRNVKPIALSCDTVESHNKWIEDIKVIAECSAEGFPYPIISDARRDLACQLNMLDPDEKDKDGIPLTARAVFFINDKKKMRFKILYPANVGRNMDEILRTLDAVMMLDKYNVAIPVEWKVGQSIVSVEEEKKLSPLINLGHKFPNFTANTTVGEIKFHDWLGDSWGLFFSHPADFMQVCTTELAKVVKLNPEFVKRNVKPIALSCDTVDSHNKFIENIKVMAEHSAEVFPYPIISDEGRDLACQLSILDPLAKDKNGNPLTAGAVYIIDDKKKMRLSMLYPANVERNIDEILRVLDALMLTDKYKVATPVDWKVGQAVMIQPTLSNEEAKKLFPDMTVVALPSGNEYYRQSHI
ncbi:peroxiredoxin-6-like [Harmonia axyridis]|uniref:peroxiredoxin-6-like n=1 Tax=Harmonia axyridis TaxID=115357 RepID=UPI001E2791FC|nr:peroxiredoxin-6-like [Harmonia axyridis]